MKLYIAILLAFICLNFSNAVSQTFNVAQYLIESAQYSKSEATPYGVPSSWDWVAGATLNNLSAAAPYTHANYWGAVFRGLSNTTPANTEVQIKLTSMWVLYNDADGWIEFQDQSSNLGGATFTPTYNSGGPAPTLRHTSEGSFVIPAPGYIWHFWHGPGYEPIQNNIRELLVNAQVRLVLKDTNGQTGWRAIVEHNRWGNNWYGLFKSANGNMFHFRWSAGDGRTDFGSIEPDKWYHVVCTYDGAQAKMYVNGTLSKSTNHSKISSPVTSAVRIGMNMSGEEAFNGLVDDLKLFNVVLNETEVSELYNTYIPLSISIIESQVSVYPNPVIGSSFTVEMGQQFQWLVVCNSLGRVVYSQPVSNLDKTTVPVSGFGNSGIYVLKLYGVNTIKTAKLLVR